MDMSGDILIEAPKATVWAALNDPKILKLCITGCESIENLSETEFQVAASVKVGPIEGRFTGKLWLSDLDPPHGYTISGEVQGGSAGFVDGSAKVDLAGQAGGTKLSYSLSAKAGGELAQLDTHVVDSTATGYVKAFLTQFAALVSEAPGHPHDVANGPAYYLAHEDHDHDPTNPHYFGFPLGVIIAGFVAVVSVGITLAKYFIK